MIDDLPLDVYHVLRRQPQHGPISSGDVGLLRKYDWDGRISVGRFDVVAVKGNLALVAWHGQSKVWEVSLSQIALLRED